MFIAGMMFQGLAVMSSYGLGLIGSDGRVGHDADEGGWRDARTFTGRFALNCALAGAVLLLPLPGTAGTNAQTIACVGGALGFGWPFFLMFAGWDDSSPAPAGIRLLPPVASIGLAVTAIGAVCGLLSFL